MEIIVKKILIFLVFCSVILQANNYSDGMRAYRNGDFNKAKVFFELSAKKDGTVHAQYMLGRMYLNGEGVTQDIDMALKLLNYAFDSGNIPAGCYISEAYMKKGIKPALIAEGLVAGLRKKVPHCKKVFAEYKNYSFPTEFNHQ